MNAKLTIFALLCLSTAAMTASETASEITRFVNFENNAVSIDTVVGEDGNRYITLNGLTYSLEMGDGFPSIPYERMSIEVPLLTHNFSVKLCDVVYSSLGISRYKVYPGQTVSSTQKANSETFQTPLDSVYGFDGNIALPLISDEKCVNGNTHTVYVSIPLVDYNPISGEIRKLESCNINLRYSKCSMEQLPFVPYIGKRTLDKAGVLKSSVDKTVAGSFSTSVQPYYYILAPESLKESLDDIVLLKKQKGYKVIVRTVEEIIADSKYNTVADFVSFDKESHIRNWLRYEYDQRSGNAFPLLIVGDYRTSAPIRKFRDAIPDANTVNNDHFSSIKFIPTDTYFSDIVSKFQINYQIADKRYGYVNTQPFSPQLHVGRLLAYSQDHIKTYSTKLIEYEIDPGYGDRSYLGKGFVSRQYQHRNYPSLLGTFPVLNDSVILRDDKGYTEFALSRPTGKEVIDGMRNCGIISLQGHGCPGALACAGGNGDGFQFRYIQALQSYGQDEHGYPNIEERNGLDCLNNKGKPSIVYSLSCDVTPFDSVLGSHWKNELPFNIGAGFTVAGGYGGVAFIGNTRTGIDGYNIPMELDFGRQIYNGVPLGEAMYKSSNVISNRYAQFTRNLIGDPDILVWKGEPMEFNTGVTPVKNSSNISMTDRQLKGAVVSVFDGIESKAYVKMLGTSASINLAELGLTNKSDFMVAIYKDGFLPQLSLFAQNAELLDVSKAYILRNLDLKSDGTNACYTIMDNGRLRLKLTEDLLTDNGFKIKDGGIVNIQAHGKVTLANDVIENGGKMDVEASEVFLQPGFNCEVGSDLGMKLVSK